jgi:hypothetical protein
MCTIILQEDGIISVYLKEIIQTSLTFLQDVAPKVKQYKLTAWKRKGNEVHISNLKDKIDLIKAYLKEIIKEWCTEYCTDEEWTKWVSSILQIDTKVLTDTDDSTSFIINLTDEQQVPLFKDKKARMKACERILVFGFHTGTGQQYNYSRQCYKYTEEEQENIRRMVDETVSELKRIKQNEEKSLHNSKQEGVIYRENKWGNGLAPFLQNSAAPRAVDTSRALLKQQALQERRKREADRRQKLNNNENRPNQLPPVPGALQRPEVSLAQAMEIAKAVTQLPAFQSCLVNIMQAIVSFNAPGTQITQITEEHAEFFCFATIMPLYSWIFGMHTYTHQVAKAWCYKFWQDKKTLAMQVQQWFAMSKNSNIIQQNNFALLKVLPCLRFALGSF